MTDIKIAKIHYLEHEGEEPQYEIKKNNTTKVVLESELKKLGIQTGGGVKEKSYHRFIHSSNIVDIDKIGQTCHESYPCRHTCDVLAKDGNIHKTRLTGKEIYEFYSKNDLHIPTHFKDYKSYKN